jgi:LytS/YehU family sensor histidine kinase
MLIVSIISGFLYYWEGIVVTNSKLQEERIKILDMEKKIVQTRLRLLQAPVEPNFLFNTLKQVLRLIDSDIQKAKKLQLSLIQYLRLSLSKLKKETHTIRHEMDMICAYLDILQKHPGSRLDYKMNLSDTLQDLHIPPMLVFVVIEMIVDSIDMTVGRKYILTLMGKEAPDGTRFELTVSATNTIDENDILLKFQVIRERFNKSFGNMASLLLKSNLPDHFRLIIKLRS